MRARLHANFSPVFHLFVVTMPLPSEQDNKSLLQSSPAGILANKGPAHVLFMSQAALSVALVTNI
jgi:hypothetical protein